MNGGSQSFIEAIVAEDDLGAVVRAGTYIEAYLRTLIERNLMFPDVIRWNNMFFQPRLELAVALGEIDSKLLPPLRKFAAIRNAFAHHVEYVVTDSDVRNFRGSFVGTHLEQFDIYAKLEVPLTRDQMQLRAGLLVLEQNLSWAASNRTSDALLHIRKERKRMEHIGLEEWLKGRDD